MARMQILTDRFTGEAYFKETITGRQFRRTTGALVWPCVDKGGCALVLGELRSIDNSLATVRHDLFKLEEKQSADPAELCEWAMLLTDSWFVKSWATPLCDKRAYMLDDVNAELRKLRRPRIRYGDPQAWTGKGEGQLPFYHALIQRRTMSEKTLFLGDYSQAAFELERLGFEDANSSLLNFPSAAALCFAVAEVDLNPRYGSRLKSYAESFGPADGVGGY